VNVVLFDVEQLGKGLDEFCPLLVAERNNVSFDVKLDLGALFAVGNRYVGQFLGDVPALGTQCAQELADDSVTLAKLDQRFECLCFGPGLRLARFGVSAKAVIVNTQLTRCGPFIEAVHKNMMDVGFAGVDRP
jgi:hypothetical protein